jgi:ABC-type transport system substrate-binding protein
MRSMSASPARRVSVRTKVAAVGTCLLLLSGCTDSDSGDGPKPRPSSTISLKAGGKLSFGVLGSPATLDPYSPVASDLTRELVRPLYPSLYRFLPDGSAVPYLARSLEESGSRAIVTLAEASWSNGKRITARDVAASVQRATEPSGFAGLEAKVCRWVAPGRSPADRCAS